MYDEYEIIKMINNLPFQIDDEVKVDDWYVADKMYVGLTGVIQDIHFGYSGNVEYKIKLNLPFKASKYYLGDTVWFPGRKLKRCSKL